MLNYDHVAFRLEPFPIGVAKQLFAPDLYAELCATFPAPDLLRAQTAYGHRYSLHAERERRARGFFAGAPAWREFRRAVRSRAFVQRTLEMLAAHGIELRSGHDDRLPQRLRRYASGLRHGRLWGGSGDLHTELVFHAMPPGQGCLLPHTDVAAKIVNIAISMSPQWDPAWGGATHVEWPLDPKQVFDPHGERRLPFDRVRTLDALPFGPNQAVIVVKTFNSWHSIPPLTTSDPTVMRRTVNINLVRG